MHSATVPPMLMSNTLSAFPPTRPNQPILWNWDGHESAQAVGTDGFFDAGALSSNDFDGQWLGGSVETGEEGMFWMWNTNAL